MGDVQGDLQSYYEEEARRRRRTEVRGFRVQLREGFIELMQQEGRHLVVDFGAGPGLDGRGFVERGIDYVGLDLAHGNAVLAAEARITVLPASLANPPLRRESFDAAWSMSTMMHIPGAEVPHTLENMVELLKPGAPMLIGLWGAQRGATPTEHMSHSDGQQRLFDLRSLDTNRALLSAATVIASEQVFDAGADGWEYQVFGVRNSRET